MAFSTGNESITLQELQSKISDGLLVSHYLGIHKIPCIISSPLRKDVKPSFGLYSRDGKKINWIDFATKERGGMYDLLSLMWNCSLAKVITRIHKDFLSGTAKGADINTHRNCKVEIENIRNNVELKCKVREWQSYDIDYWASYGVPIEWLKYAEVYPISHKIIIKGNKTFVLGADKYAYAFVERKEGHITLKIYQPYNQNGYKWSNKHDKSVVSLWTKIPEYGDKLVICSSLKDALCLWANTGIPAIAIQGEGYSMSNTAINELRRRYKDIYVLLDNDKTGLEDGIKLSKETGFINVVLPQFKEGKDISDFYKCYGKDKLILLINKLLDIKDLDTQTLEGADSEIPF